MSAVSAYEHAKALRQIEDLKRSLKIKEVLLNRHQEEHQNEMKAKDNLICGLESELKHLKVLHSDKIQELDEAEEHISSLNAELEEFENIIILMEDKMYKNKKENTKNNLIQQNLPLSIPNDVLNIINDYSDDKYTNIYKSVVKDIPFAADHLLTMKYKYILDVPFWNETTVFQFAEVRSQISRSYQWYKRYNYNYFYFLQRFK